MVDTTPFGLVVMTYNVRYADQSGSEQDWNLRRDMVASVIRFHRPDVVGLQEADPAQVEDLDERLERFEWLVAGRREGGTAGEYAAIGYDAGRFELLSEGEFWLTDTPDEPNEPAWDAKFPRLVRYVQLEDHDTGHVTYHFNTHFDHAGDRARVESARLLRTRISEIAGDASVVLTGDLNSRVSTEPYALLTGDDDAPGRTLFDTHFNAKYPHHGPETTMTDFRNLIPDKKIDFVLVTDDLRVNQHGVCADSFRDGRFPSDHLPVVVTLSAVRE